MNDDLRWVKAVQDGDQSAFEVLFERYRDRTYRLAFRFTGDADSAQSACLEAFARAYRGLATFNGRAQFGTWLYRIALNVCRDQLRRTCRERERFVPLESEDEVPAVGGQSPRSALLEQEKKERIMQAIDQLPTKLRVAWILFSAEGLKIAEIADIEGCSVGAVKSRIFHARRRLQKMLRPYLQGD